MESTAVDNVVYTGDNGIFQIHTCTKVHSFISQPTWTSCTNMLGGEYTRDGEYSSRQRCVPW